MAKSIANYRQKPEAKWMNRKAVGIDVSNGHSTFFVFHGTNESVSLTGCLNYLYWNNCITMLAFCFQCAAIA